MPSDVQSSQPIPWKKIFSIVFWLWGFPPVGLWMLWRDESMSRSTKGRVLIYSFAIPVCLAVLFMLREYDAAEKAIQAAGGGY